jgi:hypothetical protein
MIAYMRSSRVAEIELHDEVVDWMGSLDEHD